MIAAMARQLSGPVVTAMIAVATAAGPSPVRGDARTVSIAAVPAPVQGDARDRTLVLVAPPAVLVDAVRTSLAPWQIRIIVVDRAVSTPAEIAGVHRAGFVAIGSGGELHLHERDTPTAQRRRMAADLDEADAAALALTIKTWMRLEPAPIRTAALEPAALEPAAPATADSPDVERGATPGPGRGWQLGATAAVGVRGNQGGHGNALVRAVLAVGVATRRIEVAAGIELGPDGEIFDRDQPAAWSERVGFIRASRRFALPHALSLRPIAGVALIHAAVEGHHLGSGQAFAASRSNLGLDGALELGWRSGHVDAGLTIGLTAVPMAQRLHDRSVQFALPAHIEPWAALGVGAAF